ncbi:MAG: ribosome maturation factor RimM [Pseudomonadota bacterium]
MVLTDRQVTVGEIRGAHGVRGWVKLFSFTDPRDNLLRFSRFKSPEGREYRLLEARTQGKTLVGRIEGVDDRDTALALNGTVLQVPRSALPETDVGEYYWSDLIGAVVTSQDGHLLGKVDHLLETGAHDVMVVKNADGAETLVPFVMERYVLDVDLEEHAIQVDWSGVAEDGDSAT